MGSRGPVPKRSSERIRRNKDEADIDNVEMIGQVEIPELGMDDPHPLIVDFYESLKDSGQSKFYEPSDWQFARVTLHFLNEQIKYKTSGHMMAVISSMLTNLLVTEGDRRRVRLEVEREQAKATVIDVADRFREMLSQ
jgi:hypothetical protein